MLNAKDRQHLKQLAHARKPTIHVGKKGFSESLSVEVDSALLTHELIKVKFLEAAAKIQDAILSQLCSATQAELVESRGHVATLYRKHPENPRLL